jgi:hypothetical protein
VSVDNPLQSSQPAAKPLSHRTVRGTLPTIHQRLALSQLDQWLRGRDGDLTNELEPNRLSKVGGVVHWDNESAHASDDAITVIAPYIPEIQRSIRTLEDEGQAIDGDALNNSRATGLRHWPAMIVGPSPEMSITFREVSNGAVIRR